MQQAGMMAHTMNKARTLSAASHLSTLGAFDLMKLQASSVFFAACSPHSFSKALGT